MAARHPEYLSERELEAKARREMDKARQAAIRQESPAREASGKTADQYR